MATTADDSQNAGGVKALRRLKSTDAPLYLSASPDLSEAARLASKYLYSSLKPYTPKSPFAQLLTDGFDAEQIWQQIDLQSEPLLSSLRRQIRQFEKKPEEISKLFNLVEEKKRDKEELAVEEGESEDFKDVAMDDFDDEDDVDDDDEEEENDDDDEEEGDDGEKSEDGEEENGGVKGGLEDKFFKVNQLEEYMEADEAREYGLKKKTKRTRSKDEEEDEEDEEEDEDEDEDELGFMGLDDDEDDENGGTESARYDDFFGSKKGTGRKKNVKSSDLSDGLGMDDDMSDDNDDNQKQSLSTHEKELVKLRSTIEEMEKANLEEKAWTMQGEVTAARRPKNSALEVDLDFEHNVRPAPVITEEVTASLEELIQKRIVEGRFDDVQKPPSLPSRAPRETKELDDNKSKKGLAEIYEEEYVQKTGLVSTALSFSDEQKKEATMLFKKLCLKLDALSHFHFTPKPVIEDMSVQANVPALAMEEIAPVAVSDAAMLAPEEVFSGKGDVKEETELTQAERKRRRAKKKRKFKAESSKRMVKAAPQNTLSDDVERNEKS
ncbi:PREDICTED: U3 small nucleolar ribonucleoprotein protein MPP10 isoform X2 [Nicotiana attenuata]|uniref:U3 small nucleolar ribonucleoprotein protein MPP10 isoform X2 n=1 Tax=Nicotiana attenuata TaxID=49451 RepID=UPI0009046C13|nr:PREDICTED: U3 small nucleolar ribonucleoprotein protein MPP10 isoform X2 [Nicotiana attenuata]